MVPRWRETVVFYGINEPRYSDRLSGVRKPLETAASGTAVTDGNFSPNKRSDFRIATTPSIFYGLNTASQGGFSSIFFPWGVSAPTAMMKCSMMGMVVPCNSLASVEKDIQLIVIALNNILHSHRS
jgi:hypothetical protein